MTKRNLILVVAEQGKIIGRVAGEYNRIEAALAIESFAKTDPHRSYFVVTKDQIVRM